MNTQFSTRRPASQRHPSITRIWIAAPQAATLSSNLARQCADASIPVVLDASGFVAAKHPVHRPQR